jgi:hypothetical protein
MGILVGRASVEDLHITLAEGTGLGRRAKRILWTPGTRPGRDEPDYRGGRKDSLSTLRGSSPPSRRPWEGQGCTMTLVVGR